MQTEVFKEHMMRLALMFQPGKFDGPEGQILSREYWDSFGEITRDDDFINAVTFLRDHHDGFFPQVKEVRKAIEFCAKGRTENEKASRLRLQEPVPDPDEVILKFKQLRESITIKGMDVEFRNEDLPQEPVRRCDGCVEWKGSKGQLLAPCRWAWNDKGTVLASSGKGCGNFKLEPGEVPF